MTGRVQVARAVVSLYHLSYWPALWASEESNLDLAFYRSMYARAVRARFRSTGGLGEDRTPDLLHAMQTRSQLRYKPIVVPLAGLEPATPAM
jgi:hypothetical protein